MPGLLRGVARTAVIAGTATAVSNRVSRRQAGRWAHQDDDAQQQQQAQQQTQQPAPAPEPPENAMDQKLAQLKDLAALKDQGVLSAAEFEAQKQRILGA